MSERSKAEQRMIRVFEKHGGKRFRILRSAEVARKNYTRPAADPDHPTPAAARGAREEGAE